MTSLELHPLLCNLVPTSTYIHPMIPLLHALYHPFISLLG